MGKNLSPFYELLRADGSIVINKSLCAAIGLNETIIYSELLSRYNYFSNKDELDEEGYFYNTVIDLESGTMFGKVAQKNAINNLVKCGLIKCKLKGNPPKRYFLIINDTDLLISYLEIGKHKIEEVEKKRRTELEKSIQKRDAAIAQKKIEKQQKILQDQNDNPESIDMPVLACNEPANWLATSQQIGLQRAVNNTNLNKTKFNNTYLIQGVVNHTSLSIPYIAYVNELIKKRDVTCKKEIVEIIRYYFDKYHSVIGKEHTRYIDRYSWKIINKLEDLLVIGVWQEYKKDHELVDLKTIKTLIDMHFANDYKGKMDYKLMCFLSGKVLENRYFDYKRYREHEVAEE